MFVWFRTLVTVTTVVVLITLISYSDLGRELLRPIRNNSYNNLIAELNKLSSQRKKNVLFIMSDDFRASLNAHGDEWAVTPNINRLLEKSTLFQNAHAQVLYKEWRC